VRKQLIKSICVRSYNKIAKRLRSDDGQALPIVLAILAIGSMVIGPFLNHAGTNLIAARDYQTMMNETYAAEAGAEQAIWALTENGLALKLPDINEKIAYVQDQPINGYKQNVTVTKIGEEGGGESGRTDTTQIYRILSAAGNCTVSTEVKIDNGVSSILAWSVDRTQ
jgi:hypothetical protein